VTNDGNLKGCGLRIEHSRKHGSFDRRYPPIRHTPAAASLWRLGRQRLDWRAFLARFFPDSRRHDYDALAAYESYRIDSEGRPADGSPLPALGSASSAAEPVRSDTTQRGEDRHEPPAPGDTERWEGDGGASTGRSPRTRKRGDLPERTPADGIGARSPQDDVLWYTR
jgi:hypothetical protein